MRKSCPILNFVRFVSPMCIVTCSREKSHSLPLALTYKSMCDCEHVMEEGGKGMGIWRKHCFQNACCLNWWEYLIFKLREQHRNLLLHSYLAAMVTDVYFVSAWVDSEAVPSAWCCLWNGISTFHTTTSCHTRRLESTERSCWRWLGH